MINTIKITAILLLLGLFSCNESLPPSPTKPLESCQQLSSLASTGNFDQFYQEVSQKDLIAVRRCFEEHAKKGEIYNFGALINAHIATKENENLFKPDIRKASQFISSSNDLRCFFNTALYTIANSKFFDDFLVIDQLFPALWNKRDPYNLRVAAPILRTLREVIYEIRLGEKTTSEKITAMRERHLKSLNHFNQLDTIAHIYKEIITSYEFDKIEWYGGSDQIKHININTPLGENDYPRKIELENVKNILNNSNIIEEIYGNLDTSKIQGGQDLWYLNALFSALDPWGKIARHMALVITEKNIDFNDAKEKILSHDGYGTHYSLEYNQRKFYYFHSVLEDKNNIARYLIDPLSKTINGRIYVDRVKSAPSGFHLIAKSMYSNSARHQIAEIFRYSRNEWEKHTFFGPPTFSKYSTLPQEGGYKDYLHYLERDNL